MLHNLSKNNSLVHQFVAELRDTTVQTDRMRFRRNLERLGEIMAYEISKTMAYKMEKIQTPLAIADCTVLQDQPVLANILRAAVPMYQGLLNYFDKADNAFISALEPIPWYKEGKFEFSQLMKQLLFLVEREARVKGKITTGNWKDLAKLMNDKNHIII